MRFALFQFRKIIAGILERDALAVLICILGIGTERDITALGVQLAVILQHTFHIVII